MTLANHTQKRIGVLGASRYTGAELLRLLLRHPLVEIALLTADRRAGEEMRRVFAQFSPYPLPPLVSIYPVDWEAARLCDRCAADRFDEIASHWSFSKVRVNAFPI